MHAERRRTEMKHKIFLSYSNRDKEYAEGVAKMLEEHGFPCFMASRDMPPGGNFGEVLAEAIRSARMLIVVEGDNTFDSHQIMRELSFASQENLPLLVASLTGGSRMGGQEAYYLAYSPCFDLNSTDGRKELLAKVAELDGQFDAEKSGGGGSGKPDKPYDGKEPYIFISYSHKDMSKVFRIIKRLQQEGFRVWYDDGIDPATEWDENIAQHISDCGYLIAFISNNYIASNNCKDEINFARDLDKDRLLVYIEDTTLPLGMSMRLRRLQAIHEYKYDDKEDFYGKLLSAAGIEKCR